MPENLHLVSHPIVQHKLTAARDRTTDAPQFRSLLAEISELLVYEALAGLETEPVEVSTPFAWARGSMLRNPITLVPILRSGLGMLDGALRLVPQAHVGHLGAYRDPTTYEPVIYYNKLPPDVNESVVLMLDAMLATGASCCAGIDILKRCGVEFARVVCLIATPKAVNRMADEHPDVPIYTAAIDPTVTSDGRIGPGLGDVGARLFGTA
jgi:uracil phosphoribosyltransferase